MLHVPNNEGHCCSIANQARQECKSPNLVACTCLIIRLLQLRIVLVDECIRFGVLGVKEAVKLLVQKF